MTPGKLYSVKKHGFGLWKNIHQFDGSLCNFIRVLSPKEAFMLIEIIGLKNKYDCYTLKILDLNGIVGYMNCFSDQIIEEK